MGCVVERWRESEAIRSGAAAAEAAEATETRDARREALAVKDGARLKRLSDCIDEKAWAERPTRASLLQTYLYLGYQDGGVVRRAGNAGGGEGRGWTRRAGWMDGVRRCCVIVWLLESSRRCETAVWSLFGHWKGATKRTLA